ncbi:putative disease resistance RPP13-like protein 1 isoform X1 [Hevea brasiliensis]|uniref:putative disease resistance RPP13-like protein 1 isoform X1 n=2 Tax=Hevea brasiliensis TaxID=3981 RepID=UPI0025EA9BAE|nr:putative disease resistance RPP13-like protein 1 isoform X1 [Hevea brasiliensis]XP_057989581.1 putative disease resistance RPP13-like protein 1 isoform X1 [Hevea brasiliensis]XP_057989582.1 putative disease resistance RPP13-like protein 1 isoform X1 [Hevea brasiliensis]XP_057989583.1 putative disease resistance RPP13-like protein 1 isoform X1 [Hevea brasiliensis]XP_057989584.1 putative disease resistance RPP13-like protein 1 isoform X1 [Hevea brasiliensis]
MALGEAVLSAFLQVLFDRFASYELIEFFRRRGLDEELLKKLRITILAITAVLNDAEEKQITNPSVKDWLVELKDTVYQAEDLLDLISTELLRCTAERNSRSMTKQEVTTGKQSKRLPTTSLVDESCVYGREGDREEIIKLLLSDDAKSKDVGVITIVGMGGVGKTTLAQLAYNDCRVKEQFVLRAWACISQEFDIVKITKTILESITMLNFETEDLNQLQVRLMENLAGKKFIIVLDDFWNENYNEWDVFKLPFRAGMKGSKLIITTRNANAASAIRTVPSYYLQPLSFEDCWLLFAKHAFEDEVHGAHPNLEVIGKAIVKKSNGIPLAAKTLAGLLHGKLSTGEWENVLYSEIWDLPTKSCEILPVLRLSYHYLPVHLKRCFAYCSIFPKGYIFEKEKLVLLWMAEGLLQQPGGNKLMEEVGDEYFRDLVSRSLFQLVNDQKSLFTMHDLINDLAKSVSGKFCFHLEEDHKQHDIFKNARHSSHIQGKYDCFKRFEVFACIKNLRTFIPLNLSSEDAICYISDKVPNELLPTLTYLRVLSLSHYKITSLSESISNLIYLRYLDLSHTAIRRLPESVTNLYNLQTLLLSFCYLTELPENLWKLINLRHLDIRGSRLSKMPLYMGQMKELQRLTNFVVGESGGSRIRELRELSNLRGALSISKLQYVVHANDAQLANFKDKPHLDELMLEWDNNNDHPNNDMDVLEKLQPHRHLKLLSVKCYGGAKFPNWIGNPSHSNLVFLSLSNCKNCKALPTLGQLPLLKDLVFIGMNGIKSVGPEFYGASSSSAITFPSLETLRFEEMMEWEDWVFFIDNESQGFPNLEVLCLLKCPKLASALPTLPSLRKLELEDCDEMLLTGISCLPSLLSLNVISNLTRLPEGFLHQVTTLKELRIAHCSNLSTLSNQVGFECLSMLERFEISCCQRLMALPPGLYKLTSIRMLRIDGCPSLVSFPDMGLPSMLTQLIVEECEALQSLPGVTMHSSSCSTGLTSYSLHPSSSCSGLPTTLKEFRIMNCKKLVLFPEGMLLDNTTLERLNVFGCHSVKSLSLHFPNLEYLDISGCINLESFPEDLQNLTSLKNLTIMNCPLPCSFLRPPPNLISLEINHCDNLMFLPDQMHIMKSLQRLHISNCPQITCFPDSGLPTNLNSLTINNCLMLMPKIEWELHKLFSLRHLEIARCPNLESFPEEWPLPSSLSSLHIFGIPNLTSLPKAIQYLNSLEILEIGGCSKLLHLPEGALPTSLSSLHIRNCPFLKDRCQKDIGADWYKIAHIPCITINYVLIS